MNLWCLGEEGGEGRVDLRCLGEEGSEDREDEHSHEEPHQAGDSYGEPAPKQAHSQAHLITRSRKGC